jgi:uncharacterized protein
MQYGATHYDIGSRQAPQIKPKDIAEALSRINRFNGHSRWPLSVARHSVFVARILADEGHSEHTQLYGLVHDVHETVVGDLIWGVKNALPAAARVAYEAMADAADEALYGVLGVQYPMPESIRAAVKRADWIAVATEKRDLMHTGDRPWTMMPFAPSVRQAISTFDPREDAVEWLSEFHRLSQYPPVMNGDEVSPAIYAV